jgi:predicted small lipoprotein YifL
VRCRRHVVRGVRPARQAAGRLLGIALALTLSGCGQKGPLYLPDKGGQVVTSPPAAAPAAGSAPAQPAPGTSGQPAQGAPADAAPSPTTPTKKKTDQDSDSQTPQTPQ